jgi:phage host-nuclease inhibitor protein Gam
VVGGRLLVVTVEPDLPEIKSKDEAEAAMAIIAAVVLLRDRAIHKKNRVMVLAQRRGKHIEELNQRITRQEERLKKWSKDNLAELGEKKSLELRHGVIGFRRGNRATRCLEGWTWELVLNKMRRLRKRWGSYIKTTEDVNRQQMLSDSRPECGKLSETELKRIGVEIWRDEHFFVDVKIERAKE